METIPRSRAHTAIVWLTCAVLTLAFYEMEHNNKEVSRLEAFTVTGDEMAERAAEGDLARRLTIPALAFFGGLLLLRRDGWRLRLDSALGWLLLGYVGWCAVSIAWSDEPMLTLRHVAVLLFCCIAALGVARQITPRELCQITLVVATILIANSVYTELSLGTFRPFDPEYRFAGVLHPNVQAPYCATMALAAACLASRAQRGRILLWALCLAGVGLLVLTKSRTVCGAFLAGLLIYGLYGVSWPKKALVCMTLLWAGSSVAFAGVLVGWDVERKVVNAALIGRNDEVESLSGRVPIWASLIPHLEERPLFGHGYQTFWTPQQIAAYSANFQCMLSDGHSAYLDAALDLGIVGVALCLVAVVAGIREVARRYLVSNDIGYAFMLALLAYRSLNALLESAFAVPTSFVPFVMMCGLAHLGFCRSPNDSSISADLPQE
jgi:O-antigen ligase